MFWVFLSSFHIKELQLLEVQSRFGYLKTEVCFFSTVHQYFVKMELSLYFVNIMTCG